MTESEFETSGPMSTEELDKLTEEEETAEKTTEETEAEETKVEETKEFDQEGLLSQISELREGRTSLKEENAVLEEKLTELGRKVETLVAAKTETKVLSPLEQARIDQDVDSEDEVVMDGKIYREQREFERKQDQATTEAATAESSKVDPEITKTQQALQESLLEMSAEVMGAGLDFQSVYTMATQGNLLSEAALNFLKEESTDYKDFYKRVYDFSIDKLSNSETSTGKLIKARVEARKTQTETKDEVKTSKKKTIIEELDEEVEDQDDSGSSHEKELTDFVHDD